MNTWLKILAVLLICSFLNSFIFNEPQLNNSKKCCNALFFFSCEEKVRKKKRFENKNEQCLNFNKT